MLTTVRLRSRHGRCGRLARSGRSDLSQRRGRVLLTLWGLSRKAPAGPKTNKGPQVKTLPAAFRSSLRCLPRVAAARFYSADAGPLPALGAMPVGRQTIGLETLVKGRSAGFPHEP